MNVQSEFFFKDESYELAKRKKTTTKRKVTTDGSNNKNEGYFTEKNVLVFLIRTLVVPYHIGKIFITILITIHDYIFLFTCISCCSGFSQCFARAMILMIFMILMILMIFLLSRCFTQVDPRTF